MSSTSKPLKQSLPECAVRIPAGCFKALCRTVQKVGAKKFALFLGKWWKGRQGAAIWRVHLVLASSSQEALVQDAKRHLIGDVKVLGGAIADYNKEKVIAEEPPAEFSNWLLQFNEHLAAAHATMLVNIAAQNSKASFRVFQAGGGKETPIKVWMTFLLKRLANESFNFLDVDLRCVETMSDMINEAVTDA